MNVCPKCNLANVEYFIAGYCPSCAGKIIGELEAENEQLKQADKDHLSARKGLEQRFEQLQAELEKLKEQRDAIQRRAEAAESDWQIAEAENKQLQAELEKLKEVIKQAIETMESAPVQANGEWETGMFCGLEDRNIQDRYEACRYGYDQALEKVQEWIIDGLDQALNPKSNQTQSPER